MTTQTRPDSSKPSGNTGDDLRGIGKMAIDATTAITSLVEAMHRGIKRPLTKADGNDSAGGIAGLVYSSVRGVTRGVGIGVEAALKLLTPALREVPDVRGRDNILSIVNGVMGDYLRTSGNPLALDMQWRVNGKALSLDPSAISAALPQANGKVLVMIHGLCMNDLRWQRQTDAGTHDHGAALQHDLGYTTVYLRYNTGLHISENGRQLARELEALLAAWPVPVESLSIVTHSMGGLVARSACHYGSGEKLAWRSKLKKLVFIGTPHTGAPLERGGHWITSLLGSTPYAGPMARLGKLRSSGITDLRHGSVLDEDWQGRDRFVSSASSIHPLPLPTDVDCYAIAGTSGHRDDDLSSRLLGDGLVPLASALGQHDDPKHALSFQQGHTVIVYDSNHLKLLGDLSVYEAVRQFLTD